MWIKIKQGRNTLACSTFILNFQENVEKFRSNGITNNQASKYVGRWRDTNGGLNGQEGIIILSITNFNRIIIFSY